MVWAAAEAVAWSTPHRVVTEQNTDYRNKFLLASVASSNYLTKCLEIDYGNIKNVGFYITSIDIRGEGFEKCFVIRASFIKSKKSRSPTIDALLMPRGGGHGVDRVELDDGLNESDVTMML